MREGADSFASRLAGKLDADPRSAAEARHVAWVGESRAGAGRRAFAAVGSSKDER
jgi:hypothetical protein